MTGDLEHLQLVAGMWRGDLQRASESRRILAAAALDAMDAGYTVQEVADTIGWTQRASVYNLLKEIYHA
jgi:predicted transcriptional regulator